MRDALLACLRLGFARGELERGSLQLHEDGGGLLELVVAPTVAAERVEQLLARAPPDVVVEQEGQAVRFRASSRPLPRQALARINDDIAIAGHELLGTNIVTSIRNRPVPGYDASEIAVMEGLQAIRVRPRMYVGEVDTPLSLIRLMLDAWAEDVIRGRCGPLTLTYRDGSIVAQVAETLNSRDLPTGFEFAERISLRLDDGLTGMTTGLLNALSSSFRITTTVNQVPMTQRWRIGRRVYELEQSTLETRGEVFELEFIPDPTIFRAPVTIEAIRGEVVRVAQMLPSTVRLNDEAIEFDSLEPLARGVIGNTSLWSERLFVDTVENSAVRVQVAIGLSADASPPLRILVNTTDDETQENLARRVFGGALLDAVALHPRLKRAPLTHVAGVLSLQLREPARWGEQPELSPTQVDELVQTLAQPLSVYLDAIPLSRERLADSWSPQA